MLVIEGLNKAFGMTQALRGVSFEIEDGQVHGLVGHNGSGKSTVVKILASVHSADSGTVRAGPDGRYPLDRSHRSWAMKHFHFVHQDLAIADNLSVLDNLRTLDLQIGQWGLINWDRERAIARRALAGFGLALDLDAPAGSLSPRERALVACARSLQSARGKGDVIVLDEPTSYLPGAAAEVLFSRVSELASSGASVLLVSHHLEEILEHCDVVTVLRDGMCVETIAVEGLIEDDLVEKMLGRTIPTCRSSAVVYESIEDEAPVLKLTNVSGRLVSNVSFAGMKGQIIGIAGLIGSGADDLPYVLSGDGFDHGTLQVAGASIQRVDPSATWRAGIEFLPARRDTEAGAGHLTILENLMLHRANDVGMSSRWISVVRERTQSRGILDQLGVIPANPYAPLRTLSGGNQQKVLIARRMAPKPRVLVLAEPTQGVDVGARLQIHSLVRSAAESGVCVIVYSSDLRELVDLCDRVLVLKRGTVAREVGREDLSESLLLFEVAS